MQWEDSVKVNFEFGVLEAKAEIIDGSDEVVAKVVVKQDPDALSFLKDVVKFMTSTKEDC